MRGSSFRLYVSMHTVRLTVCVSTRKVPTPRLEMQPQMCTFPALHRCIQDATFRILLANLSQHPSSTHCSAIRKFKRAFVREQPRGKIRFQHVSTPTLPHSSLHFIQHVLVRTPRHDALIFQPPPDGVSRHVEESAKRLLGAKPVPFRAQSNFSIVSRSCASPSATFRSHYPICGHNSSLQ